MSELRIVPFRGGKFVLQKKHLFGWKDVLIDDVHPGHGGSEIWPMQATKAHWEKFMRIVRIGRLHVPAKIDWKVMDRISRKFKIDYMYAQP
jgi:hypothetical protein